MYNHKRRAISFIALGVTVVIGVYEWKESRIENIL
jgi:hypothetical protein